jgi:hypothetical protein
MKNATGNASRPSVPTVPREYGGKWIAWNRDGTRILAAADDLRTAEEAARKTGEQRPRLERVPRSDVRIIGGAKR